MTPDYLVISQKKNITHIIKDRLISILITEEEGLRSDSLILTLDNRDSRVKMPETGAEIEIWLGYEEKELVKMGLFTANEVSIEAPSRIMTITANASDMKETFKERKERSWENITIEELAGKIAGEHGCRSVISDDLREKFFSHIIQNESDLHFLTRISMEFDAVFKIAGGNLVMVSQGRGRSASGKKIPCSVFKRTDLEKWAVRIIDRDLYKSVKSFWYDKNKGKRREAVLGNRHPVKILPEIRSSEFMAEEAALAAEKRIKRGKKKLDFYCSGKPELSVESPLEIKGTDPFTDGHWIITKLTHELSSRGFKTRGSAKPEIL